MPTLISASPRVLIGTSCSPRAGSPVFPNPKLPSYPFLACPASFLAGQRSSESALQLRPERGKKSCLSSFRKCRPPNRSRRNESTGRGCCAALPLGLSLLAIGPTRLRNSFFFLHRTLSFSFPPPPLPTILRYALVRFKLGLSGGGRGSVFAPFPSTLFLPARATVYFGKVPDNARGPASALHSPRSFFPLLTSFCPSPRAALSAPSICHWIPAAAIFLPSTRAYRRPLCPLPAPNVFLPASSLPCSLTFLSLLETFLLCSCSVHCNFVFRAISFLFMFFNRSGRGGLFAFGLSKTANSI